MEWPNENVIRFLELYQMHPLIWDPKNVGHKNKHRLNEAWLEIQNQMGEPYTVKELKRKKESLMAAYRSYRTKIRKSELEGTDVYEPTWFAYSLIDSFLGSIYKYTPSVKVEDQQSIADSNYGQDDSSGSSSGGESDPLKHKQTPIATAFKRKHFLTQTSNLPQMFNGTAAAVLPQQFINTDEDECLLFSKLVAIKLRKVPEERRDFIMLKINEVFYNESQERHKLTANNNPTVE